MTAESLSVDRQKISAYGRSSRSNYVVSGGSVGTDHTILLSAREMCSDPFTCDTTDLYEDENEAARQAELSKCFDFIRTIWHNMSMFDCRQDLPSAFKLTSGR